MKHLALRGLLVPAFALALAFPAFAGDLKLTIDAGRVTLIAQDVPVRQILDEWARVGQTKIVNGEKIVGPPVTLQLVDVPEKEALDIVLRSASGYMAAPRAARVANASQYDRIMIMATSRAPMAPPPSAAAPAPFQRPPMQPPIDDDEPDDDPVNVPAPAQPMPNNGVVGGFPGAQPPTGEPAQNQTGPLLSSKPGVPVGVPPNMQQQPNGQPMPYQPTVVKPVGPGGGGPGGGA
jgi:hypothetical protein